MLQRTVTETQNDSGYNIYIGYNRTVYVLLSSGIQVIYIHILIFTELISKL